MAAVIRILIDGYSTINNDWSDPRTKNWPLCGHLWLPIAIVAFYNYFVASLGPRLMEKREPFKVENIMIVYNLIQIVVCAYLTVEVFILTVLNNFNWLCEPIDFSDNPAAIRALSGAWMYYLVKLLDLLDTVFIILRKRYNQASFLHVYHHSGMVGLGYIGVNFVGGGHGLSLGLVNSMVHTVMYTYYLCTSLVPEYKKSVWWKKYITQMQMIQFAFLLVHFSLPFFQPNCTYPRWISFLIIPQYTFMLILFADFYRKAYGSQKAKTKSQ